MGGRSKNYWTGPLIYWGGVFETFPKGGNTISAVVWRLWKCSTVGNIILFDAVFIWADEIKCIDIAVRLDRAEEHNMNIMMRENKIIISCQSHIETVKVSPGNSQTAASALDTRERQKQRQRWLHLDTVGWCSHQTDSRVSKVLSFLC